MNVNSPAPIEQPRGRIDKRKAILAAAFKVFAEQGFEAASVDEIAAEAGVAKPTIYNHFANKEQLFFAAMDEIASDADEKTREALESFPPVPTELESDLYGVARRINSCYVEPQLMAFKRLLVSEAMHFPQLNDLRERGANRAISLLSGKLAQLAHAGYLDLRDPVRAANQFIALISSELQELSASGTRQVDPAKLAESTAAGVETFVRAFQPRPAAIKAVP